MRRFIISFFSIIILYVLQTTVFQTVLNIAGIAPNLLLMFTCIVGFMRGRKSGMLVGFFAGLLVDVFPGGIVGFTPFIYICIGYFNGMFYREYTKEQMLLPIALVALSDLAFEVVYYITSILMRSRLNFVYYMGRIIIPEIVYTVLVTIFAYMLVYHINRYLDYYTKRKLAGNVKRKSE